MLLLATAATSALFTPPIPLEVNDWVDYSAYQSRAVKQSATPVVNYSLVVSPKGRAIACSITSVDIASDLAALTCKTLTARAHFRPAKDASNIPSYSVFRSWIFWKKSNSSVPPYFDLVVFVNKLPAPQADSILMMVDVKVDQKGSISDCRVEPGQGFDGLDDIACQQVRGHWQRNVVNNEIGQPVSSLQVVKVGFAVQPPDN